MDERQQERLGAATGIAFVVLLVAGFVFGPDKPPGFNDTAQQVSSYVHDNRDETQAATGLFVLGGFFFLWPAVEARGEGEATRLPQHRWSGHCCIFEQHLRQP